MNREKMSKLPEMQIEFIDSICQPMYHALAILFPKELGILLQGCITNRDKWEKLAQGKKPFIPNFSNGASFLKRFLAPIATNNSLTDTIMGS